MHLYIPLFQLAFDLKKKTQQTFCKRYSWSDEYKLIPLPTKKDIIYPLKHKKLYNISYKLTSVLKKVKQFWTNDITLNL
jgi:hypothetical protein